MRKGKSTRKGAGCGSRLSGRDSTQRLKTAKGRKNSSARWLQRQLNDPYVAEARRRGYASRAAFKLMDLDDRFGLLARGRRVVDLGAAPGGWSQVAAERVGVGKAGGGRVAAVDVTPMEPPPGVAVVHGDIRDAPIQDAVDDALGGPADVVLSDMAAPATGHAATDHLRIVALAETALEFAVEMLTPGGAFVCKVLQGGTEATLLAQVKQRFADVRHAKPPSSRAESAEVYLVARGFRPTRQRDEKAQRAA